MRERKEPIRVLQVVTNMDRGGLETMLMNYYRHVDRESVQFDFLTHRADQAAYDDEIKALGGRIYHLPRLIPWSRSYGKALNRFFAQHPEYQIVHVHQDCLSSVILQEAKKCGVPVRIAHSHNADQDKNLKYPIKLFYMRSIPRYATDLMACSQKAGEWMFRGAPFTVLHNAIDAAAYSFDVSKREDVRRRLKIPEEALVLGHVGRFMPQKNHEFLLDIFSAAARKEANARLLLIGDGDLRAKIEAKAQQLGLSDRVIFTGVRADVPDLLQAMDLFVLPSLYEGLGIAAVEAQASGLPCVISDRVPNECMVTRGLVTEMCLSDTPEQWAEHILSRRNAERTDRYEEVSASGYDIVDSAKRLEQFYLKKKVRTAGKDSRKENLSG